MYFVSFIEPSRNISRLDYKIKYRERDKNKNEQITSILLFHPKIVRTRKNETPLIFIKYLAIVTFNGEIFN